MLFSVLIELRASFKLALSIKDYKVALHAYWILIFAALFGAKISSIKVPSYARELLIMNGSVRKRVSTLFFSIAEQLTFSSIENFSIFAQSENRDVLHVAKLPLPKTVSSAN